MEQWLQSFFPEGPIRSQQLSFGHQLGRAQSPSASSALYGRRIWSDIHKTDVKRHGVGLVRRNHCAASPCVSLVLRYSRVSSLEGLQIYYGCNFAILCMASGEVLQKLEVLE